MAEAVLQKDANANSIEIIAPAALTPGEIIQLPDGRASRYAGELTATSGDTVTMQTAGAMTITKTSGVVVLDGAPVYWDRSAGSGTPLKALAGADFYAGTAVGDSLSADTTMVVDFNVTPKYTIDALRDETDTVLVGDATVVMLPGYAKLSVIATSEAEKCDIMSKHSVPVVSGSAIPFILEGRMAIYTVPSGAATDINIGLANDTHATSADSITESMFIHFDNALDILVESDDGTTEVAATDSTVDASDDTYFDFAFDCRDLTDIQVYIDGVLVLPATVFKLDAATGPIKILAHAEKTTGTETCEYRVSKLAIRPTDVA